nr:Candidapepsin-7 like [Ipomoea batatas]
MSSREKIRLPLRKLFTKEREAQSLCSSSEADEMDGILPSTYCVWRPKAPAEKSSSPKNCKKRNSTGWSKRWKLRDLIHRNNSEGNSYSTIIHTHKKKALIFQSPPNFTSS